MDIKLIAGKTHDEIVLMDKTKRSRWYKIILPDEKEEAMRIMKEIKRAKNRVSTIEQWKDPGFRNRMTGKNNPMYGRTGKNSPIHGITPSEEIKTKLRAAWTPEKRAEASLSRIGKTHTEKTKAKRSKSLIEKWKDPEYRDKLTGENHHFFNKNHTEETRIKQSISKTGENNPNWQGGKLSELYGSEFNDELTERIRMRDNYICQECNITQKECISKYGAILSVHHIDYNKKNNKPENLICLCPVCHGKTGFNRNNWIKHFGGRDELDYLVSNDSMVVAEIFGIPNQGMSYLGLQDVLDYTRPLRGILKVYRQTTLEEFEGE